MNVKNKTMLLLFLMGIFLSGCVNANRWLGSLEQFELKELSILSINKVTDEFYYVRIIDPNDYIHTAILYDIFGKNHGQIIKINKEGIELKEAYHEGKEVWFFKTIFLKNSRTEKQTENSNRKVKK